MNKLNHTGSYLIVALLAMLMSSCSSVRHAVTDSLLDEPLGVNRVVVEQVPVSYVSETVTVVEDTVYHTNAKKSLEQSAVGGHRTDVLALMAADSILTSNKAAQKAGKVTPGSKAGAKRGGYAPSSKVNGGQSRAGVSLQNRAGSAARQNTATSRQTSGSSQQGGKQSGQSNASSQTGTSQGGANTKTPESSDDDPAAGVTADSTQLAVSDSIAEEAADTIQPQAIQEVFGDDFVNAPDTYTPTDEDNPFIMKLLLVLLLLLLAAFIAYIIYTRKQMEKLKEHERQQLFDLRMKHSQDADRREGMKSIAQGKAERALLDLQREKDAALSEKEAAENAKVAAESAQAAAENAKVAAETATAAALSEKMIAEKAKDEALAAKEEALAAHSAALASLSAREEDLAAKEAELNAQKSALAAKDAELNAANAEISAQKDALAARDAELSAVNAELTAARDEIAAALAAAAATAAAEPAAPAEPAEAPVAEAAQTNEDRTAAINTMRKMIMRKIESAQAIVDLKGLKKGDVLTEDELKDIASFLENVDNKFVSRFSAKFPDLTRKDVELMMLLRLRLPSKNLASVYGINEKSIKQKLFVYKTKVGLETDPMSLRDFIENF